MTDLINRYYNLIRKADLRENFLNAKLREENNNFGVKAYKYEKVNDIMYLKITNDIDQASNELTRKLNIHFA